jgi:natural product precursor
MKKLRKLEIKKVTLQNLDEPLLNRVAGGNTTPTCVKSCGGTCFSCNDSCGGTCTAKVGQCCS